MQGRRGERAIKIQLPLPRAMLERLDAEAQDRGVPRTYVIRERLQRSYEREEKVSEAREAQ